MNLLSDPNLCHVPKAGEHGTLRPPRTRDLVKGVSCGSDF
jgi:hypothetical protein